MKAPIHLLAVAALLLGTASAFSQQGAWSDNYAKAVEQAKAENKPILLDFTGSDWCAWCMTMKRETLDTPQFTAYAQKNLVLVTVDFPQRTPQTPAIILQNERLDAKYQADGFPTYVLIDKFGRELGRQSGYLPGGPAAFIARLNKFYPPRQPKTASSSNDSGTSFKKSSPTPKP